MLHLVVHGIQSLFHRSVVLPKGLTLPRGDKYGKCVPSLPKEAFPMKESVSIASRRLAAARYESESASARKMVFGECVLRPAQEVVRVSVHWWCERDVERGVQEKIGDPVRRLLRPRGHVWNVRCGERRRSGRDVRVENRGGELDCHERRLTFEFRGVAQFYRAASLGTKC